MAALPHPNRQRLRSPGLLPRTRPGRHQAPRHSVAIHAIPTSPLARAETQTTYDMGSGCSETTLGNDTAAASTSEPRHRRPTPQHANRPRRPDPDEQRPAETGVPAVQRRRSQRTSSQQRLQQSPARAGENQTRSHASTRKLGPAGFRQQHRDAVRLATMPEQHGVHGQVDDSRSHNGSAGDVESRGLTTAFHVAGVFCCLRQSNPVGTRELTHTPFYDILPKTALEIGKEGVWHDTIL
jgi:hypothetical protein